MATTEVASPMRDEFPFDAPTGASGQQPTNEVWESENDAVGPPPKRRASGNVTPSHRRSVQFVQDDVNGGPLQKTRTWDAEDGQSDGLHAHDLKSRQATFLGKLKSLANNNTHNRTPSSTVGGYTTPTPVMSPQSERSEPYFPPSAGMSEAGAEADAEGETDEEHVQEVISKRKKLKLKRPVPDHSDSTPATPMASRFASFIDRHHLSNTSSNQEVPHRDATRRAMSDIGEDTQRAGVSEDEGRDRIRTAWRRGIEGARGLSYAHRRNVTDGGQQDQGQSPEEPPRRPHGLRRITGLGSSHMDGTSTTSPFGRYNTASAARWRQVKAGLKALGQRKKDEKMRVDYQKSAQLMAELMSGAPAVIFLASMLQRDEHGHHKIPVLLEQLKVRISDTIRQEDDAGDKHLTFVIDLEYGNGPARMQWQIRRNIRDFAALHASYLTQTQKDRFAAKATRSVVQGFARARMPKFPRFAVPYMRSIRGFLGGMKDEDFAPADDADASGTDGQGNGADRPGMPSRGHTRMRSSFTLQRRTSSGLNAMDANAITRMTTKDEKRDYWAEQQRRTLQIYLQSMIRWLIFRPDSTRLCKFLELSALAMRLSAEGGYQGKQGLLRIVSRDYHIQEMRKRPLKLVDLKDRAKRWWFLIRHSYVVCVDGPESLMPYEVFLVDSDFRIGKKGKKEAELKAIEQNTDVEKGQVSKDNIVSQKKHHLSIRLYNSERKLKLYAKNERLHKQFLDSLEHMMHATPWSKKQRFGSFAPARENVWARWLVDGRDHMWQVSRAMDNAKDFIYIHDWWLSPELYMRRPAAISHKWRLDRLLKKKAEEGVKIFVIVYRNIESAIPIDSEYTKWSLLDLHPNICVQRSPNQFRQNQFFWAHHEKLVVVDNMMAFVGGVDLCFGRWDDPCHSLTDDKLTGFETNEPGVRNADTCQIWPGKDYSNPRVQDFYSLNQPYEEMYDRTKVPRMPWHDIAMQIVGQPARDVGRHFVQRWNYVLRQRVPSRPTPVLLPPPEFESGELEALGMTGTCEVQILRSCSHWSIGTPNKVEHSIMNAYVALIEASEHFVYIENQFFISSCTVEGTTIHNKIGDALVERAIRAHENGENWKACLVIPLMPGFQNSVDSQDGTSVRLIMQCQFRSICRGDTSIFGRLKAAGIPPEDYIRFYSLRQWGKIGPRKILTTEQLYIHAKCMVVDDRAVIIGSANINERSLLGSRDSEVASIVRDTRMIDSTMDGEPYRVGEFPHTLRKRLMREHLGIDVDALYRREQDEMEREMEDAEMERMYGDDHDRESHHHHDRHQHQHENGDPNLDSSDHNDFATPPDSPAALKLSRDNLSRAATHGVISASQTRAWVECAREAEEEYIQNEMEKRKKTVEDKRELDVEGFGFDNMRDVVAHEEHHGLRDTFVDEHGHERLRSEWAPDMKPIEDSERDDEHLRRESTHEKKEADKPPAVKPPWPTTRLDTYVLGLATRSQLPELPALDDTDIGGPPLVQTLSKPASVAAVSPLLATMQRPTVTDDCMRDPISALFYDDIWNKVAENNTRLYRQVFRCMPDSEVLDWRTYEKYNEYNERFMQSQGLGSSKPSRPGDAPDQSGPPGSGGATELGSIIADKIIRDRSKSLFGTIGAKLRPGSRASGSTVAAALEEKDAENEKVSQAQNQNQQQANGTSPEPGSNLSVSGGPTAVATPDSRAADIDRDEEKEALRRETIGANSNSNELPNGVAATDFSNEKIDPKTVLQQQQQHQPANANVDGASEGGIERRRTIQYSDDVGAPPNHHAPETTATASNKPVDGAGGLQYSNSQKQRRRRGTTKSSGRPGVPEEVLDKDEAEDLLKLVQGALVQWPYDWLEKEEKSGNWLYNIDQIAPLEIYD